MSILHADSLLRTPAGSSPYDPRPSKPRRRRHPKRAGFAGANGSSSDHGGDGPSGDLPDVLLDEVARYRTGTDERERLLRQYDRQQMDAPQSLFEEQAAAEDSLLKALVKFKPASPKRYKIESQRVNRNVRSTVVDGWRYAVTVGDCGDPRLDVEQV